VVTRFIAGAGGVALRGAVTLDPSAYAVTILSSPGGNLLERVETAGLRVIRLRHMRPEIDPLEDARALWELEGHLEAGAFDIIHTHSAKAGAIGRVAGRRLRIPALVHTFHGFPFHDFQSPVRRRLYIEAERRLGRFTSRFMAVGGAVGAEAIRLGLAAPERVRVIEGAIDLSAFASARDDRVAARRRLRLPDRGLVIGSVGRLDRQKAPHDLVRAAARMVRERPFLVLVGDGPLRGSVERMVAREGMRDRLLLLGERTDVPSILPAFDVFAMSSLYEGLPCAVVEAMTSGIPVVATAVNAVPDVVRPGVTGILVPPARPDLLARAIGYLARHPDRARVMAENARRELRDRFAPERLGDAVRVTYEEALGEPVQRSGPDRVVAAVSGAVA
jgi:glycosyltransferase involved in cell wall biosynthesis